MAAGVMLLLALLAGWWEAALFGLVVLAVLDLLVLFRARGAPSREEDGE
jgi:hypothetical protein